MGKKSSGLCVALIAVSAAFPFSGTAAVNGQWIGGASGSWNDPACWQGGVPSDVATILPSAPGETIEITVDGDYAVNRIDFGGAAVFFGASRPLVKFKGSGSITSTKSWTYLRNDMHVVFDGVDFNGQYVYFRGNSNVLEVTGGAAFKSETAVMCPGVGNRFVFRDGDVLTREFPFGKNSVLEMSGGTFRTTAKPMTFEEGCKVVFTGGKIFQDSSASPLLLPKGTGELHVTSSSSSERTVIGPSTGSGTYHEISGKVFVTNSNRTVIFNTDGGDAAYGGRGELYAEIATIPSLSLMEWDLSKVAIGTKLHSHSESIQTRLLMYGPLTLGAYGDWTFPRAARVDVEGVLTADTLDCFDRQTVRSFELRNVYPSASSSVCLTGGGTVTLGLGDPQHRIRSVSLTDGTDLVLSADSSKAAYPPLCATSFSAGAGSEVSVVAGVAWLDVSDMPSFASGSSILASIPPSPVAGRRYPVLVTDPSSDLSGIPVTDMSGNPDWTIARSPGCIYYTDGTVAEKTVANEWTGAADRNLGSDGNWNGNAVPAANSETDVFFSGATNCDLVNDRPAGSAWRSMSFTNAGPWRITGNKMTLNGGNNIRPIVNSGDLPVVIDCDVYFNSAYYGNCTITSLGESYILLNGKCDIRYVFAPSGDVRVGGDLACTNFYPQRTWGEAPRTCLTVCDGGSVTVVDQSKDIDCSTAGSGMYIAQGGSFTVAGGTRYNVTASGFRHQVNGEFDCAIPFTAEKDVSFEGDGTVHLASVASSSASASVRLRGGIRMCPGTWSPVTAENPDTFLRLVVETRATLTAANDWTYGVAPGIETEISPADRGILVSTPLSVLTVDTSDPETDAGHSVTFADPVTGYGRLVKTGAGTLLLESDANALTGGVTVVEGTLAYTADQSFASFSVAPGASLRFGWDGYEAPVLTVGTDVDLTGVLIAPVEGASADIAARTTVIEAVDGARITGTPVLPPRYGCSIKDGKRLTVFKRYGTVMTIK